MNALLPFWSHAIAAACFLALAVWRLRTPVRERGDRLLLVAYVLTAVWAWLSAIEGYAAPLPMLAETARNLAWIGLLHSLSTTADEDLGQQRGLRWLYGAQSLVIGLQLTLNLMALADLPVDTATAFHQTSQQLRMVMAAGALIIIHNLYGQAAPSSRGPIRLAMFALALTWGYDLNLYTFAYLESPLAAGLFAGRGIIVAATMPLFAIGGAKGQDWRIQLSRTATFQSLSLLGICGYFAMMTVLATALKGSGRDWGQELSIIGVALLSFAALVLLPSARARSWAKVKLAKHFFEHRYDYRAEWLRFTGTIGRAGADAAPLGERVIQAFADIVEAPGGVLLVADESGAIDPAASWRWPDSTLVTNESRIAPGFWETIEREGRVLDLDSVRGRWGTPRDRATAVPDWLIGDPAAWVGVPLIHHERLIGLVVLAAPDYRRAIDWEDFDLLRTAGRQAASSLAEAHGQEALTNAQRFEEFNRRFAFILHDVKNLVSQLSLLSRNAERHADNPEFRADMVATLKSSVGKMNDLLARLAPQAGQRSERAVPTPLRDLLSSAIAAKRRDHEVRLLGDASVRAIIDPLALEQAVGNLLQNAIDASPNGKTVVVRITRSDDEIVIAVIDQGIGMDAEFIRHRLFQPFASTKADGFGVGAFEARSLVAAMGGRLTVTSAPGKGSTFSLHLPAAQPAAVPERKSA